MPNDESGPRRERSSEGPQSDTNARPHAQRSAPTAAETIVELLCRAGLTTFFGIPGGPVIPFFDAILTHPSATLIEPRHEAYGVFEAIGYHRATGRVPVIVVTAGPGATNVITGVVAAHLERVPMVVLCGDVAWASTGQKLLQDVGPAGVGIEAMLATSCRAVERVSHGASAAGHAQRVIDAATCGPIPGPALLVVSIDQAGSRAAPIEVVSIAQPQGEASSRVHGHLPSRVIDGRLPSRVIDARTIDRIERRLREARRPLVVVGAGCRQSASKVAALIDAAGIPFVTTPQAKGIVSEEHRLSLRTCGMAASWWARRYMSDPPDVALVLGTDLDDVSMAGTPPVSPDGDLFHVDLVPSVFGRNYRASIGVVCDVGAFAEQLASTMGGRGCVEGGAALAAAVRGTAAYDHAEFADDASIPIAPHRVVADLMRSAPRGTTFVTDIGEHMLFALHYLTASGPGSFVIHLGLGSMGSGIGSSIGLALGDRTRPVVCICGDGGMQMAGAELLVAVKHRLSIVYVVFNDGRYNMVYHGYRATFGREAPFAAPMVDFVKWAESLGARSHRIERPGDIEPGRFATWLGEGGPVVLDVRQDSAIRIRGDGRIEAMRQMSLLHTTK